jgi:hypothetical protein
MPHRKAILLIISFYCISLICFSQQRIDSNFNKVDLIGVWQSKSQKVASALKANFRFFNDGRFVYTTDQFDDLNPLKAVNGFFKVGDARLFLRITDYKILSDFQIVESNPGFQFGSFDLDGGNFKVVRQNDTSYSTHSIEMPKIQNKKNTTTVIIDNIKYFKVSSDPLKFQD